MTAPALLPANEEDAKPGATAREFQLFGELIHRETGIYLRDSKRQMLMSRLGKRLRHFGFETLAEYYDYLAHRDPARQELRALINCITTNKTSFFREAHQFEFLRRQLQAGWGSPSLRIWSAACSTGEEPYSIAMAAGEVLGDLPDRDVRILASDIDTDVLSRAETAIYPETSLAEVPEALQHKYFLRGKGEWRGQFQVRPQIRSAVTFRRINFFDSSWPIHARFHAIFCRNVLIYFDREGQRRIVDRLLDYLRPDGYFFSGSSENLVWLTSRLSSVQPSVYRLKTP